jgi:hypothetical protein
MHITAEKLIEIGGERWTKHGKDRVYFNENAIYAAMQVRVTYYGTGRISSVSIGGSTVSNSYGRKYLSEIRVEHVYYDLVEQRWNGHSDVVDALELALEQAGEEEEEGAESAAPTTLRECLEIVIREIGRGHHRHDVWAEAAQRWPDICDVAEGRSTPWKSARTILCYRIDWVRHVGGGVVEVSG